MVEIDAKSLVHRDAISRDTGNWRIFASILPGWGAVLIIISPNGRKSLNKRCNSFKTASASWCCRFWRECTKRIAGLPPSGTRINAT